MDGDDSDHLKLRELLIKLEDRQKHLKSSTEHLENEIKTREIEILKLKAERELELIRNSPEHQTKQQAIPAHSKEGPPRENQVKSSQRLPAPLEYNSNFAKQVSQLLSSIGKTTEEVSALIKLR